MSHSNDFGFQGGEIDLLDGGGAAAQHSLMSQPLISAALIVRNEERFIARCLTSIKDIVDEMVVVDTGSTDRTPAIAAELGARVSEFPWCDDFAAARNVAIERSAGKWILYIDADEAVRPTQDARRHLERVLAGRRTVGAYVMLQTRVGFTPYWEMRIFRNAPGVRFEGIIHETIWPALQAYRLLRLGKVAHSELYLEHLGYEGTQDHKHARNLPLLERAIEINPKHVYCRHHLGRIHLAEGREDEARTAWQGALDVVRRKRSRTYEDLLPYTALIELDLSQNKFDEAMDLLGEGRKRFPDQPHLEWLLGRTHMEVRRFEEAIAAFQRLIDVHRQARVRHYYAFDQRMFTAWPNEAIATCYFQLARYAEAARHYEAALEGDPDVRENEVKRVLCTRLAAERG